jgi:hypothetical protein
MESVEKELDCESGVIFLTHFARTRDLKHAWSVSVERVGTPRIAE